MILRKKYPMKPSLDHKKLTGGSGSAGLGGRIVASGGGDGGDFSSSADCCLCDQYMISGKSQTVQDLGAE